MTTDRDERPVTERIRLLFLRHAEALRGYATGLTGGDASLADDLVQEAFLVADRRAADFRPDGDFHAWTRGILRNLARSHLRARAGRAPLLDDATLALVADAAPEPEEWAERRAALAACLATLAPRAREIAELRYRSELLPPAIAERVRWSVNAVNVALSRVRAQLRACCERRLAGGRR